MVQFGNEQRAARELVVGDRHGDLRPVQLVFQFAIGRVRDDVFANLDHRFDFLLHRRRIGRRAFEFVQLPIARQILRTVHDARAATRIHAVQWPHVLRVDFLFREPDWMIRRQQAERALRK